MSQQAGPLMALMQLVQENPDLPAVRWSLAADGFLMGDLMVDEDARPIMAAFVAVFGGQPTESRYSHLGVERFSLWLPTTWRDVRLSVTVICPADALAPAGLPAEWSSKAVAA
ncbi:hypothetical protein OG552_10165 [Streptomyces sp. NBC_01476]|uniref:hypothetical protein n=1 Tax=Streptomyces sp. NBC_01476 TaxID=2903881 RepID=UPI002E2FD190|nr:hypothetical protein [Streptomyces sp. NBC_01476]